MPVFEEDPTRLSKSRLRSDLVAHSVVLPCDSSRKAVYVDLHLKHIDPRHAADFSSDEEDQVFEDTREKEKEEEPPSSGVEMRDIIGLTNDELKATLLKHGVKAGPIVASTRALYERRLAKLLHSYGPEETALNGKGDANTYSDSEEEEEEEEDDVDEGDKEVQKEESDSGDSRQEAISHLEQAPEGDKQEHVADGPTRFYPKTGLMPTGVAVTCRRPIKGAAGRPVQYKYPDLPPASPLTLERRGVERRLVPVYIQMVVFLAMAGLLYLVYACMEENPYNPLLPLLDGASEAMTMVMRTTESEPGPADPLDRAAQDSLSG